MPKQTKTAKFPIVLKSIITDTIRDDKTFTLNEKQIRSRLRTKFAGSHAKNTSWVAHNAKEYDAIRSTFDGAYATKIANARKRAPKAKAPATTDAE